MGLRAIVTLSCLALAASEPGLFGPGTGNSIRSIGGIRGIGDTRSIGGIGGVGGFGGFTDIDIIDLQTLLQQFIEQEGYKLSNIEIHSEQMKQVNSRLQAELKFSALRNGVPVDCAAQIYAYISGQSAQILDQSDLNCVPTSPGTHPGSQFLGAEFPGSQFPGAEFPGSQFPGAEFPGSQYSGSQFSGSQYSGSQFPGSQYSGTLFPGSQYSGNQFPGSQFPRLQYPVQFSGSQNPGSQYSGLLSNIISAPSKSTLAHPPERASEKGRKHPRRRTE